MPQPIHPEPQPADPRYSDAAAGRTATGQASGQRPDQAGSRPGGFANDPDDADNPNEAIERSRRQLRP